MLIVFVAMHESYTEVALCKRVICLSQLCGQVKTCFPSYAFLVGFRDVPASYLDVAIAKPFMQIASPSHQGRQEPIGIREDDEGVYRIGSSRVTLDSLIGH